MPSHESSIRNLVKAVNSPNWHRPRPWRSKEEAKLVKRFVFQWFTCRDRNKPSGRDWACHPARNQHHQRERGPRQ